MNMIYQEGDKDLIRGERFSAAAETLRDVIRAIEAASLAGETLSKDSRQLRSVFFEICNGREYITVPEEAMIAFARTKWEREIQEREAAEAEKRNAIESLIAGLPT